MARAYMNVQTSVWNYTESHSALIFQFVKLLKHTKKKKSLRSKVSLRIFIVWENAAKGTYVWSGPRRYTETVASIILITVTLNSNCLVIIVLCIVWM